MKTLIKEKEYADFGLFILRVAVGIIFIYHGVLKVGMWSAVPNEQLSASMLAIVKFLSIVEPLGGLGLIFGVLAQYAALGFVMIMLGAIFLKIFVMKVGFSSFTGSGWEFDLILLAASLYIFLVGSGSYSLDIEKDKKRK